MYDEHPGERLLEFLQLILEKAATGYNLNQLGKQLWCDALGIHISNKREFVFSIQRFRNVLEEWRRLTLSIDSSMVRQNFVDKVFDDLNYMVLDLAGQSAENMLATCQRLEVTVGIGIQQVSLDIQWDEEVLSNLREDAVEWRTEVRVSSITPVWKRNILDALDELIDAIDNYRIKGSNNFTDALIKWNALSKLPQVITVLSKVGINTASRVVDILEKLGNSSPLMLPPGNEE